MFAYRSSKKFAVFKNMLLMLTLLFFLSFLQMLNLCYVYYLSKLTEFADTIFFVLKKKKSQLTWLHLYHHSLTPLEAWILVKFLSGNSHFCCYFVCKDKALFRRVFLCTFTTNVNQFTRTQLNRQRGEITSRNTDNTISKLNLCFLVHLFDLFFSQAAMRHSQIF